MFTLLYFAAVRERLGRDRDAIHAAGPPPPPPPPGSRGAATPPPPPR
jgi:hypothetical protein